MCELQKCNYSKTRAFKCLYKEFGANRVTLSVKFWSFLPDQEHFKNQASKLAPAFLKCFEILRQVRRSQTVFVLEVFTDHGMLMFLCTLMEVAARVTDIICIAQITCKFVQNTLLEMEMVQRRAARYLLNRYHTPSRVSEMLQEFTVGHPRREKEKEQAVHFLQNPQWTNRD